MKKIICIAYMCGVLASCGGTLEPTEQDKCAWPDDTRLVFKDCGATLSGQRCAVGCGYEPLSGTGDVVAAPIGCIIYPKTTDEHVCVASCAECN